MDKWIETVPLKEIFDLLPDDFKQQITKDSLKELDESKSKSLARKRFYKVRTKNEQFIHISCGKSLKSTFENSQSLNEILPEITCKPLFFIEGKNFSLFAQEHFQGHPVDEAYVRGLISEEGLNRILKKIKGEFEKTEKPSTRKGFEKELEKLKISVLENERLFEFDKHYLELVFFPLIEENLQDLSFTTRISNGDLAARNVLVDENENFKIIDAEFAKETHFHNEDWVRLAKFSGKDFAENKFLQNQLKAIEPVFELILNLRQTILNKSVHTEENYINHTIHDLSNCLWGSKFLKDCKNKNLSLLIEGIRNNIHNSEKELNIKNEVTNLLQSQLVKEKDATLLLQDQLKQEKGTINQLQSQLNQEKDATLLLQDQLKQEKGTIKQLQSQLNQEKDATLLLQDQLKQEKGTIKQLQSQLNQEKDAHSLLQNSLEDETKAKLEIEQNLESEKKSRLILETESIKQSDKILRMQKSFSWKITSPLRFLRRKFLDPREKSVYSNPKSKNEGKSYQDWIQKYDTITDDRITSFRKEFEDLKEKPLFSIIMPVYDPPKKFFEEALQSVISQVYTNWELCIADDRSTQPYVHKIIKKYSKKFPKIKVHINEKHSHISETSNNALNLAEGEYVVLLDHDDLLRPHSLLRFAEATVINNKLKLIYSDEDKIDLKGLRTNPYFKPDWNPELLLSQNYICHLTCIKTSLMNEVGGFRKGFEGSQDWDLFLRLTEILTDNEIFHIPEILYHWRITNFSTANSLENKTYCSTSAKKALNEVISRRNLNAMVIPINKAANYWRIKRRISTNPPLISIIIPTRDRVDLLKMCIESLVEKTSYSKYEIILIDNDSKEKDTLSYFKLINYKYKVKILNISGPFNYSYLNNQAVKRANGDLILFLNNDIEIIEPDWLCEIASHAVRPDVGCVGSKLLYPNDTIQHAGVILGIGGVAGHIYKGFPRNYTGQMCRSNLSQNFEAVTGACLAVRKSIFQELRGFNEKNLSVAFNDIDFCLRVRNLGYKNIWTPYSILYHHESASRGTDIEPEKQKRFAKEAMYMMKEWKNRLKADPSYNVNLTLEREDSSLSFPPRHLNSH